MKLYGLIFINRYFWKNGNIQTTFGLDTVFILLRIYLL